jgi:hypothetical protein
VKSLKEINKRHININNYNSEPSIDHEREEITPSKDDRVDRIVGLIGKEGGILNKLTSKRR